jgi:hypothetical protein
VHGWLAGLRVAAARFDDADRPFANLNDADQLAGMRPTG